MVRGSYVELVGLMKVSRSCVEASEGAWRLGEAVGTAWGKWELFGGCTV